MAFQIGDRGAAVRNYQRQLQRQGYRIRADGVYGQRTAAAAARAGGDTFTPAARRPGRTQTPSRPQEPWRPGSVQPAARQPGEPRFRELVRFAEARGFTVTSTNGGHHLGAGHREGRAADVRTKDHTKAQVDQLIREARAAGYTVFDERGGGNSAWSGPHVHLEIPRGR